MKIKPTQKPGRVLVEMGRSDAPLLAGTATSGASLEIFGLSRILVPTDFSEVSRKAVRYALAFALQFKARLTLLYVLPPVYLPGSEFGPMDLAMAESELHGPDLQAASLEQLRALATAEVGSAAPVDLEVRSGQPMQEIVGLARECRADLIVLTTHGRTGLKHMLMGSVAENVVRHAPCPVLVVREREPEFVAPVVRPRSAASPRGGGRS